MGAPPEVLDRIDKLNNGGVHIVYSVSVGPPIASPPTVVHYLGVDYEPRLGDLYFHKQHINSPLIGSAAWLYTRIQGDDIDEEGWMNITLFYQGTYTHKIPHPEPKESSMFLGVTDAKKTPTWLIDSTWRSRARPHIAKRPGAG